MADKIENSVYDDQDAVKFIQAQLPQDVKGKYTDDDILLITDIIVEYYERNGWLDSDADEEIDIDVEDLEPENFNTIEAILELVERLSEAK